MEIRAPKYTRFATAPGSIHHLLVNPNPKTAHSNRPGVRRTAGGADTMVQNVRLITLMHLHLTYLMADSVTLCGATMDMLSPVNYFATTGLCRYRHAFPSANCIRTPLRTAISVRATARGSYPAARVK